MKRYILIILSLLFLAEVSAEPISLRVEVTKQSFSGLHPPCKSDNCIPWHFWYVFEAKVLDVLDGEYSKTDIKFVRLQHAGWADFALKEMYVVVDELSNKEISKELEANLVASHMTFPREVVCIPKEIVDTLPSKNKYKEVSFNKTCFYADDLIEMNNESGEGDSE